jgi:phospholipid-binding lipoprotein MlaA
MISTSFRLINLKSFCLIAVLLLFFTGCSQHDAEPVVVGDDIGSPVVETGDADPETGDDALGEDDELDEFDEFEEEFGDASESEVFDPLEGYNRVMTSFNDKLYFWVLKPVATGYRWLVPEIVRSGIGNFFHNLLYPVRFVNNLLQLKFRNAGEETIRFVYNTTFGLFGVWDPGREWLELRSHEEDFGQTLGFYGVGAGPHIVLPILGPSNLRDTFALYPDNFVLDPKAYYIEGNERKIGVFALEKVNDVSFRIGEYESVKKDAIDFYMFMRDGYEQIRIKEIKE